MTTDLDKAFSALCDAEDDAADAEAIETAAQLVVDAVKATSDAAELRLREARKILVDMEKEAVSHKQVLAETSTEQLRCPTCGDCAGCNRCPY